jgi:hypothetical protein
MSTKKRHLEIKRKEKRKKKKVKQVQVKPFSFFDSQNQYISNKKTFGLCDKEPPPHVPAYLDESNGHKWIAVVDNFSQDTVTFVALDNCIELKRPDGKPDKCSDGMLSYNTTVIFVELTMRTDSKWRKEKHEQLGATIKHFEDTKDSAKYKIKKAYIANSCSPRFKTSYETRTNRFYQETGYILRIQNRIVIE